MSLSNGCRKKDDINALDHSEKRKTAHVSNMETDFFKTNKLLGGDVTIMENIKDNWKNNKFTNDRKYIAPLPETFTKKYIKEIISRL